MNGPTSAVGGPLLWIILFVWWVIYEIRNPLRDIKGRPESILRRLMPLWIGLLGLIFCVAAIAGRDSGPLFMSCLIAGAGLQFYAIFYAVARRRTR